MRSFAWMAFGAMLLAGLVAGTASAFNDEEVRAIVRHVPDASLVGAAPGVYMGRSKEVRVEGSGRLVEREHLLARAVLPDWEAFSPFILDYWSEHQSVRVLRARVWRSDLTVVELPRTAISDQPSPVAETHPPFAPLRRLQVAFATPKAGEVLELILLKESRPRPGEFNIQWFHETFAAEYPVIEHYLEVATPQSMASVVGTSGPQVLRGKGVRDGFATEIFLAGNLPALPAPVEGGVFSRRATAVGTDSVSTMAFSTTVWPYLSVYLGRQWWVVLKELSPELTREAGEVFGTTTDRAERARRLETWVRDEFTTLDVSHLLRGARPLDPSAVHQARGGGPIDKAILLTAALRLAGIEATPVFIRTLPGPWVEDVASPDQFDRVLVRAELEVPLWLDPIDVAPIPAGPGLAIPIVDPRAEAIEETDAEARFEGLIEFPGR